MSPADCVGRHPSRCCVRALEAGPSIATNIANGPKWLAASSGDLDTTGIFNPRLGLAPVNFLTLRGNARNGTVALYNGGGKFCMVGGHFALAGNHASILLGALPPIVHLRRESDKEVLRWSIERLMEELRQPQPGSLLIAQDIARTMLLQALRLHLSDASQGRVGWLFALVDKQMGA